MFLWICLTILVLLFCIRKKSIHMYSLFTNWFSCSPYFWFIQQCWFLSYRNILIFLSHLNSFQSIYLIYLQSKLHLLDDIIPLPDHNSTYTSHTSSPTWNSPDLDHEISVWGHIGNKVSTLVQVIHDPEMSEKRYIFYIFRPNVSRYYMYRMIFGFISLAIGLECFDNETLST